MKSYGTVSKVVVVTGAGSGTGAAVARLLARQPSIGLVLHTGGRDGHGQARVFDVAAQCAHAGARTAQCVRDFGERGGGTALIDLALHSFGRVDQIVHAAGMVKKSRFTEMTLDELDYCYSVIPRTFLELVMAALPSLRTSTVGRVVAVSAFNAHRFENHSLAPATAAAKTALETLAKALALHVASEGITVNCVVPGYTRKDPGREGLLSPSQWEEAAGRTPTRRLGDASQVARAIEYLLSDDASQTTGAQLAVDGGMTLG